MKSKSLFLAIIFFASIQFLSGRSLVTNRTDDVKASIEWEETTHDFGKIAKGIPVEAKFKFKNTSMVPLMINSVRPSCGCTVADYPKVPVKPGESADIAVTYDAKNIGYFSKSIVVMTNANEPRITLYIKGEVVNQ